MTEQNKPKRPRKKPPEKKRLDEQQLTTMAEIFGQDFMDWYKRSYDADGNLRPEARIPGLRPSRESESEEQ